MVRITESDKITENYQNFMIRNRNISKMLKIVEVPRANRRVVLYKNHGVKLVLRGANESANVPLLRYNNNWRQVPGQNIRIISKDFEKSVFMFKLKIPSSFIKNTKKS